MGMDSLPSALYVGGSPSCHPPQPPYSQQHNVKYPVLCLISEDMPNQADETFGYTVYSTKNSGDPLGGHGPRIPSSTDFGAYGQCNCIYTGTCTFKFHNIDSLVSLQQECNIINTGK